MGRGARQRQKKRTTKKRKAVIAEVKRANTDMPGKMRKVRQAQMRNLGPDFMDQLQALVHGGAAQEPPWTPFQEASFPPDQQEQADLLAARVYVNAGYQVVVYPHDTPMGPVTQLSIKRKDRGVIRSWRTLQRIKNAIVGLEIEAVELYPAESRLVDTANQYHLWCLGEGLMFPFGFVHRSVPEDVAATGAVQEPFPEDNKPEDLLTAAEIEAQGPLTDVLTGKPTKGGSPEEQDDGSRTPDVQPEPGTDSDSG